LKPAFSQIQRRNADHLTMAFRFNLQNIGEKNYSSIKVLFFQFPHTLVGEMSLGAVSERC
jgi:hypothetical protein